MPQPPTFHVGASESEDGGDDMDTLVDDLLLDDEDINKTIVVGIDFGTTYALWDSALSTNIATFVATSFAHHTDTS